MKLLGKMFAVLFMALFAVVAFAQVAPVPSPAGDLDLLSQVLAFVQGFGGLSTLAKISGVIAILIGTMKSSALGPMWDKLGSFKVWAAPVLGIAYGLMSQGSLTWASAFAYLSAGAGAILLAEILDGVKAIPGIGTMWISVIGIVESVLKKPAEPAGK